MATVYLEGRGSGGHKLVKFAGIAASTVFSLDLSGVTGGTASYTTGGGTSIPLSADMDELFLKTNVANSFSLGGVSFKIGTVDHISKANGDLHRDLSPVTGNGTVVGSLTPAQGQVRLTSWTTGASPTVSDWRGVAGAPINGANTPFNTYMVTFRIAASPIRPSSFSVLGTMQDGTTFNYSSDSDGYIDEANIKGRIDYDTGVVKLIGVSPTAPVGTPTADLSFLGIPGVGEVFVSLIRQETLRYNAVAYTYLPLEASLLGIDPVRLPSDGRVPIFRPGGLAVVGHTATTTPGTVIVGTVVNCGRVRLSRVRVLGNDNSVIDTGYTEDLEAGTVTFTNVTGYSQPVRVEHRVEDLGLIRDTQIDGTVTFTRALTHEYPVGSHVSSCLRTGDLKSRVSLVFDQNSWDGTTFIDELSGTPAPGTYNTTGYPIVVTNAGALTERWAIRFTTTQAFQIVGEGVGVIGTGSVNAITSPINGITGEPYFTIEIEGWGTGWQPGNMVRFNTVGAMYPVWMLRTVQQGPEGDGDYSFQTIVRGDVDNPVP